MANDTGVSINDRTQVEISVSASISKQVGIQAFPCPSGDTSTYSNNENEIDEKEVKGC